ncbi:putative minor capsid protein [Salinicoccus roseus]|uniref:Minor capsid protein n=2 Tax=Salinicoccus roseus TaxID=45670 RepID=A0ABT4YLY9_9STAP|nr:putative minor capsid protein [Salinicoccus roseus]MDB0581381.1 putative minor capsid protein [Salinicoccus roseus]
MRVKPIPKHLLIHKAIVKGKSDEDMWGNPVPGTDVPLEHVRFEPSSAIEKTPNDASIDYESLLFIDTVHSLPAGYTPEKGSEIKFKETTFSVEKVEPVYAVDPDTPHHYEVYLT